MRTRSALLRALLVTCLAVMAHGAPAQPTAAAGTSSESWTQYGGSPGQTWWAPTFPGFDLDRLWTSEVSMDDWSRSGTCVSVIGDRVLTVRRLIPSKDYELVAVTRATGAKVWSGGAYVPQDSLCPAAAGDLVFNAEGSDLVARSIADGHEVWRNSASGPVGSPAVADGVVYVMVSSPSRAVALEASTGTQIWNVDGLFQGTRPPVVGDGFIAAIATATPYSGPMKWFDREDGTQLGPSFISPDEVSAFDALAVGQDLFWIRDRDRTVRSTEVLANSTNWSWTAPDDLMPVDLAFADGTVYVDLRCQGCAVRRVAALDASTGSAKWDTDVSPGVNGPTIRDVFVASGSYLITETAVVDRTTGHVALDGAAFDSGMPGLAFADGVVYGWVWSGAQVPGTMRLAAHADLLDPPFAPTGITVTFSGYEQAPVVQPTIRWSPPPIDARHPVTGYMVRWTSGGNWACSTTADTLTCQSGQVARKTPITYSVVAINTKGEGPAATATVSAPGNAPGPPGQVWTAAGDSSLSVQWGPVIYPGTSPILDYTATASPGGASCTTSELTCVIRGLANKTLYKVSVVSRSADGTSAPSVAVNGYPLPSVGLIVKAKRSASVLFVDVNPSRGSKSWLFRVYRLGSDGSTWTSSGTYRTKGAKETRTLNLKKGTYKVLVPAQNTHVDTWSQPVVLRK